MERLWPVLIHSVTLKTAEEHVHRSLKRYSWDLQKEAKQDLEQRASQLVRIRAPYLSSEICRQRFSASELLQRAFPGHLADEKRDESNFDTSDNSETKDVDQSTIPQIELVRRFLFEAAPFQYLQSNLEDFVYQRPRAEEPIHFQIHQRVRIKVQNLVSSWLTFKLKEGSTRLWWTCVSM